MLFFFDIFVTRLPHFTRESQNIIGKVQFKIFVFFLSRPAVSMTVNNLQLLSNKLDFAFHVLALQLPGRVIALRCHQQ